MDDKSTVTTAPPPPSEVKIRTMKSDLSSMRASGGGAPKFESVAIPGLTLDKEYKAGTVPQPQQPSSRFEPQPAAPTLYEPPKIPVTHEVGSPEDRKSQLLPLIIVTVVGVVALIAVGVVAYILFK